MPRSTEDWICGDAYDLVPLNGRFRLEARLDRRVIAQPIRVDHTQVVARDRVQSARGEDVIEAAAPFSIKIAHKEQSSFISLRPI